jgi:hypothetical protein
VRNESRSELPGFLVSRFLGFLVSRFQGFQVSRPLSSDYEYYFELKFTRVSKGCSRRQRVRNTDKAGRSDLHGFIAVRKVKSA